MTLARTLMNGRMPRRFRSHLGLLGTYFRDHYLSLEQAYGPFSTELLRQAAADAAQCHVVKILAVRAWEEAQVTRANGKGRRPNARFVVQLAKRVALEQSSYQMAINRLEHLVKQQASERKPSVADLFKAEAHP